MHTNEHQDLTMMRGSRALNGCSIANNGKDKLSFMQALSVT